jgi:hypothetical protein
MKRTHRSLVGTLWLLAGLATLGSQGWAEEDVRPEEGFVSLFNGKDLTGWVAKGSKEALDGKTESPDGRFVAKGGVIVALEKDRQDKGGNKELVTIKEFNKGFTLKLEFRAGEKAESGLSLRGPQLQVRDFVRRKEQKQLTRFKTDDWNELEITVKSGVVTTTVNGKPLTDKDTLELSVKGGEPSAKLNGAKVHISTINVVIGAAAVCKCNGEVFDPGYKPGVKGGIGLQAKTGKFEFRRLRIKEE